MASRKLRGGGLIPKPSLPAQSDPLRFSFKHFHPDHQRFDLSYCTHDFLAQLLLRLKHYSSHPAFDFLDQNNKEHRHIIDFACTVEPDGFVEAPGMDEQLASAEAWQFEVCPKSDWRVHGFIIDDTFYIVWLDPLHALAPTKK